MSQVGEGGAELRSAAPLHTTASWHHEGVVDNFASADAAVREEKDNEWTRVSSSLLPFVPAVFSPRDVVLQERACMKGDSLEIYLKPRFTHDMSSVPRSPSPPLSGRSSPTLYVHRVRWGDVPTPCLPHTPASNNLTHTNVHTLDNTQ